MAYFVLTHVLRERLVASAPSRVVNTASAAHQGNVLDFEDLQMEKHYRAMTAYGRSKLANILFTRQLARRLAGTGLTANCLHPGFVATRFGQSEGGNTRNVQRLATDASALIASASAKVPRRGVAFFGDILP